MQTRTIEIDFEVHKVIEIERRSFAETPNAALRRLLGIEPKMGLVKEALAREAGSPQGRPWVGKGKSTGLTLPHGTELALDYNGQRYLGYVANGRLEFEGQSFSTLSAAAVALCRTKDGRQTQLNGKELCQIRLPGTANFMPFKAYEENERELLKAQRFRRFDF